MSIWKSVSSISHWRKPCGSGLDRVGSLRYNVAMSITQDPRPGYRCRRFRGDTVRFALTCQADSEGAGFLRTNIGRVAVRREEIIARVEQGGAILERDWDDIPMRRVDATRWELTLGGVVGDPDVNCSILHACEPLLVPGAIRSLTDRSVRHALPVERAGVALNDPHRPYQGRYRGDEDTRRKPAYHNGTAWTWPFPSYCEALVQVHGAAARDTALALLRSSEVLLNRGCVGQIPEILDGDAPHTDRGCGAQAWGVTELYRVLALLQLKP